MVSPVADPEDAGRGALAEPLFAHGKGATGSLIDVGPAWYSRLTTEGEGAWRWCSRS